MFRSETTLRLTCVGMLLLVNASYNLVHNYKLYIKLNIYTIKHVVVYHVYIYIYYIYYIHVLLSSSPAAVWSRKIVYAYLSIYVNVLHMQNLGACTYRHIFILTYRLNRQPSRWPQSKSPEWLAVALILAQQKQESTSKWEICLLVFFSKPTKLKSDMENSEISGTLA